MTLTKDRHIGGYVHPDGLAVEPTTKSGASTLPDGQLAPVTDWPGIHLAVRDTDLVPAVHVDTRSRTGERITMTMSPTGQSPAAGITVTTQAEYDALGHDLLYPDDVFAILPRVISHSVIVNMDPGTYAAKPSNLGPFYPRSATIKVPTDRQMTFEEFDISDLRFINTGVYFVGSQGVDVAAQSGTVLAGGLLEVTGAGWTPDAYKGKFVQFTAGVNAGTVTPIIGNTSDTLTMLYPWTTGACTFEIVSPEVIFGNTGEAFYAALQAFNGIKVGFFDVAFGTEADPVGGANIMGVGVAMVNVQYYTDTYIYMASFIDHARGGLSIEDSVIRIVSSVSGVRVGPSGYLSSVRTFIYGYATGGAGPRLLNLENGIWRGNDTFIEADAAHGSNPVVIAQGQVRIEAAEPEIIGNGLGPGLYVTGQLDISGASDMSVSGCDVGIHVVNGGAVNGLTANVSSSDNVIGWLIEEGATINVQNPQNIGATTTDISIDGVAHPYSDLGSGDSITGVNGSRITRR